MCIAIILFTIIFTGIVGIPLLVFICNESSISANDKGYYGL